MRLQTALLLCLLNGAGAERAETLETLVERVVDRVASKVFVNLLLKKIRVLSEDVYTKYQFD